MVESVFSFVLSVDIARFTAFPINPFTYDFDVKSSKRLIRVVSFRCVDAPKATAIDANLEEIIPEHNVSNTSTPFISLMPKNGVSAER